MNTSRSNCDEEAIAVIKSVRLLCGVRWDATASNDTSVIRKRPNEPQSSVATLPATAIMLPKADSEDRFDAIADRPVSKECHASRAWLMKSASYAWSESTVHEKIPSVSALVEDVAVFHFDNPGPSTESSRKQRDISDPSGIKKSRYKTSKRPLSKRLCRYTYVDV